MPDHRCNASSGKFTNSLHPDDDGIFVGIGSNLPLAPGGSPLESCARALAALAEYPLAILARSRWYRSAPVPESDQPDFVNAVLRVGTRLAPADLLAALHEVEDRLGRTRRRRNEARAIDLDLIAYRRLRRAAGPGGGPVLPHPRLQDRAFVLLPLAEIAPGWRHPASGRGLPDLLAALPPGQRCEALSEVSRSGPDVIDFA